MLRYSSRVAPSNASRSLATILGANIRAARVRRGLTQGALASAVGVSDLMVVSKWERGVYRPSDENLLALARELGHPLPWFVTDHEQSSSDDRSAA